jgi:hypothetical protein
MQTKLSKQQGNERPQDKRSFVLRIHVMYDNQQQKNMSSHLIKGMKHFACYDEFEEKKYEEHITNKHGFDSRLQSQYIVKLEGEIKALAHRIEVLEERGFKL